VVLSLHQAATIKTSWPDTIHAHFRRVSVRQIGYVPDAGHDRLICRDDPNIADIVLTTEEEGARLVAGAALGGQRAALLMQSSVVGNCINMFSLLRNCGFGCVVIVTMRGEFAKFNPWQVRWAPSRKSCCGSPVFSPTGWKAPTRLMTPSAPAATWRSTAISKWLWGTMGGTAMIGLGLALARPDRRVAVITGDDDMLMGLGSLATIGVQQAKNLAIVGLDNAHYGETGMQPSHTSAGVDLVAVALACRFEGARTVSGSRRPKTFVPCCMAAWSRSWSTRASGRRSRRGYCRSATDTRSNTGSSRR
jgi:sulfopyruvate decarboxylase TPP-binding subunit